MTISERINLHRCGYNRAEIDALAAQENEERKNLEETVSSPDPKPENSTPNPNPKPDEDPVLLAINKLTEAIQARNINSTPQPETKPETMEDIIKSV